MWATWQAILSRDQCLENVNIHFRSRTDLASTFQWATPLERNNSQNCSKAHVIVLLPLQPWQQCLIRDLSSINLNELLWREFRRFLPSILWSATSYECFVHHTQDHIHLRSVSQNTTHHASANYVESLTLLLLHPWVRVR